MFGVRISLVLSASVMASACAILAAAPATSPSPTVTSTATAVIAPTSAPSPIASAATATPLRAEVGFLEGRVEVGPLTPVERAGVPSPTPSPAVCTSRGLTIFAADGAREITSFEFEADCSYRVTLPAGQYVVRLKQRPGIDFSKDLPQTVVVDNGKTTRLDISIDTGIR